MADLVMGAMGSLVPKLYQLMKNEGKLQTGVKERVSSLTEELEGAQVVLCKVAGVPWDQLDDQVKLWARQVREASYDTEDVLDTFLVRVDDEGPDSTEHEQEGLLEHLKKVTNLVKSSKDKEHCDTTSVDADDIMSRLHEVTERCRKLKVDDIVAKPATASSVDPPLYAMYNKVNNLVGIDKSSTELISMLHYPHKNINEVFDNQKLKVVSVVGVGGLGKTTLVKAVYDKLKWNYYRRAFVHVGRNPDMKKVLKDILIDLDKEKYLEFVKARRNETQLINELRSYLEFKRYFIIVIDDIWEIQSWETIKLALDFDSKYGSIIITTTRKLDVATKAGEVYQLQPLPYDCSRDLLFRRIAGPEAKYVNNNQPDEIFDKFIRKCDGMPLSIITVASLLAGKSRECWSELYETMDFGCKDSNQEENTMRILSFSYNDLPSHLRTCMLYLSAFSEGSVIPKDSLVWKWVAEGFVQEIQGQRLFETGVGYLNELINRSMIQVVESRLCKNIIIGCRVHDVVLDFIRSISIDEKFLTVLLDSNDQGTQVGRNKVRRLAYHNRTMWQQSTDQENDHLDDMSKVRSIIALQCVIDTNWVPLSTLKLLRVLSVENCKSMGGHGISIEHLGHLPHLRFLSLSGTRVDKIPHEIGALKLLQTLDLWASQVLELESRWSLPRKLVCLRVSFGDAPDHRTFLLEQLTSLEELSIAVETWDLPFSGFYRLIMQAVDRLSELRVYNTCIFCDDNQDVERNFWDSVRDLHKLQYLTINCVSNVSLLIWWRATECVLRRQLQHFAAYNVIFRRLPSCINPWCVPNLSYLELTLEELEEHDLKALGGLPELSFLCLNYSSSGATISNICDDSAGYFPKLRCCRLRGSMFLFVANKEDSSVSFHMWNGYENIAMPSSVSSDDDQNKLQGSSSSCSAAGTAATPPRFMPSLEVIYFDVSGRATEDHQRYCDKNIGWEYLSSLQEINVDIELPYYIHDNPTKRKEAAGVLRRVAEVHPNRPTVNVWKW